MKKLNKKSDLYHINNGIMFKPFKLAKVHLIDDGNEFIATIKDWCGIKGDYFPKDLTILDVEEYSPNTWVAMVTDCMYERAWIV